MSAPPAMVEWITVWRVAMKLPDSLIDHPDGEIRIAGTRIGLFDIVRDYESGLSAEQLHQHYSHIPLTTIQSVLSFYLQNRSDVDAYMDSYRKELARQFAAYKPGAEHTRVRRLVDLIEQADRAHAKDPEWASLSIVEKLRRLGVDTAQKSA